ncbi:MAG: leucine-rich repeat domain-containing protein, partial [Bacteroidales bacterium]|nr:leucine-rich repeat domain-containing protein [Bacteroidales bacterium]
MEILLNHIRYELNDDGTASVSKQEKQIQGDVNIPSAITYQEKRYRVTSIWNCAFYNCTGLTAITIP